MSPKMSPVVEMSPGISEGQKEDMGISLGTDIPVPRDIPGDKGISMGTKGFNKGQRDSTGTARGQGTTARGLYVGHQHGHALPHSPATISIWQSPVLPL
jgi:hypothetical protein